MAVASRANANAAAALCLCIVCWEPMADKSFAYSFPRLRVMFTVVNVSPPSGGGLFGVSYMAGKALRLIFMPIFPLLCLCAPLQQQQACGPVVCVIHAGLL